MKNALFYVSLVAAAITLFLYRGRIMDAFREGVGTGGPQLEVTDFKCDGVVFGGNVKNVSDKPLSVTAKVRLNETGGQTHIVGEGTSGTLEPGQSRRFEVKTPPLYRGGKCTLMPFVDTTTGYGVEYR